MMMLRAMWVVVLLVPPACTEPNPDYRAASDAVSPVDAAECATGQRRCVGLITQVCSGAGQWTNERRCPTPSTCTAGVCVPAGDPCDTDAQCGIGQACGVFVNPQHPNSLSTYCIQTVGTRPGLYPCGEDEQCRSGVCLQRAPSFCFDACQSSDDCPSKSTHKCMEQKLTVNGVQGAVHSCMKIN